MVTYLCYHGNIIMIVHLYFCVNINNFKILLLYRNYNIDRYFKDDVANNKNFINNGMILDLEIIMFH
jgi:hypothetical protein